MNTRVAVAISGGGRSLANLLDRQPNYRYQIAAVIASSSGCGGLQYAKQHSLPILVQDFRQDPTSIEENVRRFLRQENIDWIALAGFLKKFPVLEDYQDRIINIHPALLPDFGGPGMYGHKVHHAVLEARRSHSGASIHFISEHYDEGPLLSQITVDINGLDDANKIANRVFEAECELYPKTLDKLVSGELPLPNSEIWQLRF